MAIRERGSNGPRVRVVPYKNRPYGLRWRRADGSTRELSSGCKRRRDAERAAVELEIDLAQNDPDSPRLLWSLFRERYEQEKLPQLSRKSESQWVTAANWLERTVAPTRLSDVNKSMLSRFTAKLRERGLSESSIRSYLATLLAALGWACDVDLIETVPRVRLPRKAGGQKMRSRPITSEEYERILMTVAKVRPHDAEVWRRFLQGLWHSGLRVDELRRLSWEPAAELSIDTSHEFPLIRMLASGHKSRRDEFQPVTREFWNLIATAPPNRRGYVFPLPGRKGQMRPSNVVRVVSEIGKAAGVITDPVKGKTATSHDIGRRAFLTRMDQLLTIPELQKWARHASPDTTMGYYHHRTAVELGRKVWTAPS
ncbi:Tyrosine recombinase XerC [Posidoniimonas corsicana]|uniref:Tyrosine recombinase XerC n=1 Tax=Posidoniimonas corsicana TaxID=1938618 RepID=A0A5C5V5L4_9BACT|nr:Tyrosine recombinase XerC [Posidoniimonas corsicana]